MLSNGETVEFFFELQIERMGCEGQGVVNLWRRRLKILTFVASEKPISIVRQCFLQSQMSNFSACGGLPPPYPLHLGPKRQAFPPKNRLFRQPPKYHHPPGEEGGGGEGERGYMRLFQGTDGNPTLCSRGRNL